jgi:hypothetical protein
MRIISRKVVKLLNFNTKKLLPAARVFKELFEFMSIWFTKHQPLQILLPLIHRGDDTQLAPHLES